MKTADKLKKFRQDSEKQTGQPAHNIQVSMLHMLHDMCRVLNMPPRKTHKVIGRKGVQRMVTEREWTAEIVKKKVR
jgi:hypothetical protein